MAYNKHKWETGELITADKMNTIENGLDNANLIECDFKGRTKYLKGINIDSSSGIGTLIFYDGINEDNENRINFFTLESKNLFTPDQQEYLKNSLGFFKAEEGNTYIDQKVVEQFNKNFSTSFTDAFNTRIDSALSSESSNPVQNQAIVKALDNKLNANNIDKELNEESENPVQNKAITEELSRLSNLVFAIAGRVTSIENGYNTTKTLWENKSTTNRIFKMGTTIELNDNISEYDYLDVYSTFWSTEIHSSFEVPKNEKKFWIRDINIQDAQNNGGTTLSTAELQFSVNPSNNTIQIFQNQLWKWNGKMSEGPTWTGYYSDSTATGEAAISLNKVVGRKMAANLDIDSIKADIKALQEAVDELKENNNDSNN